MKTKLQIILAILTVAALVTNQPISISASQSGESNASQNAKHHGNHKKKGKKQKKSKRRKRFSSSNISDVDEHVAKQIYDHYVSQVPPGAAAGIVLMSEEIGRASCRERV